jgi:TetR/AcrR family transcriptional regulator, regulator of cefoperazone and chloramphenicol sensitivity
MSRTETDTHGRLLEAATRLFSERGFRKVTVRQICQAADANVAAVNYHFQDKTGLYRAVLERGIALIRETTELSQRVPEGTTAPEDRLRVFIQTVIERMMRSGTDGWLARILRQELANPTPELDSLVERAIRPRLRVLAGLVGEVLECPVDDARVYLGVASIQSQILQLTGRHPLAERFHWRRHWTAEDVGRHIADFSIAGLRAIREPKKK